MSTTEHLSPADVEAFGRRTLSADDLLRLDRHIAECAECRRRLGGGLPESVAAFEESLAAEADATAHPEYERLEAYVDGTLHDDDHRSMDEHCAACPACAADVADLRNLRAAMQARPAAPRRAPAEWLRLAAALFFGVLAATLWLRPSPPRVAQAPIVSAPTATARPPEGLEEALRDGRVHVAEDVAALIQPRGTLMGSAGEDEPALIAPVATAVRSDRPSFSWKPRRGGARYRVSIYDRAFDAVLTSPPLQEPRWIADRPLPRGAVYSWQVTAIRGGEEVLIPRPPAPPARFKVLSEGEAAAVEAAERQAGGLPLAGAVICAKAGLLDEAEAELERARARDPRSPAAGLLEDLKRRRVSSAAPPPTTTKAAQ